MHLGEVRARWAAGSAKSFRPGWLTKTLFSAVGALSLAALATAARAQVDTWTGAVSNQWGTTGNWSTGALPVNASGDSAAFSTLTTGSTTVDVGAATVYVPTITLSGATGFTFISSSGNTLGVNTITDSSNVAQVFNSGYSIARDSSGFSVGITVTNSGTGLLTFDNTIALGGYPVTFTGSGNVTVAGLITSVNTNAILTDSSTGTLTLTNANTFVSPTTISSGATLLVGNSLALQDSTVTSSGTVNFGTLTAATFGGLSGSQALSLTNGSATALALSVGANSSTYSGVLSGGGSLTKVGAGTLTLTGQSTYTGGTTVNAGTLSLDYGSTGGTLTNGMVTVNNGGTLLIQATNSLLGGSNTSNVSVVVNSGGTLSISSGVTAHTGNVTLAGGTLASGGAGNSTYGGFSFQAGDNLYVTANSTMTANRVVLSSTSDVNIASGVSLLETANGTSTGTFGDGSSAGSGHLNQTGAGTLILDETNTYTGGTTVSAGTLELGATGADSTGALSVTGGTVIAQVSGALGAGNITLTGSSLALGASGLGETGLGSLTLGAGASTIDFGAGDSTGTLSFANSSGDAFGGTLDILDYATGDSLYFGATGAGLTAAQLQDVFFVNPDGLTGTYGATLLANGQVSYTGTSATPEPGSIGLLILGITGAGVGLKRGLRRRSA